MRDTASGLTIEARALDARSIAAGVSEGLVVYPGGISEGATLIHRVTESGTEDYVAFDTAPPQPEVRYQLVLGDRAAGLRLVEDTLEIVDASGAPRLRVAPPYLVSADGSIIPAAIDVEGCAVDRDPSAPWDRTPVEPGGAECEVVVSWNDGDVNYPALLDPVWASTGSLAAGRFGAPTAVLPNGRVLVAGGIGATYAVLDSVELYDPNTRTWAATASLSTARTSHAVTRRANGQVLVTGGVDSDGIELATTEVYDVKTGKWTPAASLAYPRSEHRAVLLNNGNVLVAGGSIEMAEKLSMTASTWSSAGRVLAPLYEHTLTALADGRALVVGGDMPQLYDPTTNSWLPSPGSLAAYRYGHTATRLANGQVLVVGSDFPSAELFDPATEKWTRTGAASGQHWGHTATLLKDGRVVVAGGLGYGIPAHFSLEVFQPSVGTFAAGPGMITPRVDHAEALLPSGRALLVGGMDAMTGEVLASTEEFDPNALASVTSEYKLAPSVDADVLPDRMTELWASVTRPARLVSGRRYPLLVFLHGNHATCGFGTNPRQDWDCTYTETGTCPDGWVVVPNHRGYDYIASELAGRGYIVVSINANRGINCGWGTEDDAGLNLARGRLVLKHLTKLSEWHRGVSATPSSVGVSLRGAIDFSQVGLLGHSRGGEGVRAAYEQYRDLDSPWPARIAEPVAFRGIFEIGPVDGQTSRVLNAFGTQWNVLLPMCDGDVSTLEGVRPFDRNVSQISEASPGFQSTYTVWGANHNFYNTEWQESDSWGCTDHRALFSPDLGVSSAAEQRQTGLLAVTEFFQGTVGSVASAEHLDLFNPEWNIYFESPIERGYTPGQSPGQILRLEDFLNGAGTSTFGIRNLHSRVTVAHSSIDEHDPALRAATISWTSGGDTTYFQTNFANRGSGVDLRSYDLLDFRAGRVRDALNVDPTTEVEIQLVNANDALSDVAYASSFGPPLQGPVGGPYENYHQMLTTYRVPLRAFESASLQAIRGVRFIFRANPTGKLYLANVRASRSTIANENVAASTKTTAAGASGIPRSRPRTQAQPSPRSAPAPRRITTDNGVTSIRTSPDGESVEIALSTTTPFPVRDDLLILRIEDNEVPVSRHPNGNLSRVVFKLDKETFGGLSDGVTLTVRFRRDAGDVWEFGTLNKAQLDK